ncbi:MAG: helicase C-terminal domain-containing protein [Candidatus Ranarchaeia archaeon]
MGGSRLPRDKIVWSHFPYESMRAAQASLIYAIYTTAVRGGHLVIEAPNGFGKTITVLAGILPAAKKMKKKVLYCCRTHQQMDRVIEELQAINDRATVTGVSLRGRMQMCLNEDIIDNISSPHIAMELCRALKQANDCRYYTTLRDYPGIAADLASQITLSPSKASDIIELGKRQELCPYELVKDLLGLVDVTALSYNYVFEPDIRQSLLHEIGEGLDKFILVLDEAHNLPNIAVDLVSDSMTYRVVKLSRIEAEKRSLSDIKRFAKAIESEFLHYERETKIENRLPTSTLLQDISRVCRISNLATFLKRMKEVGEAIHKEQIENGQLPRSYIYRVATFMLRLYVTRGDPRYLHAFSVFLNQKKAKSSRIELISLDPRTVTRDVLASVHASISLSGTLTPIKSFIETIGLPHDTDSMVVPSPFSRDQMRVFVTLGVSTAMRDRSSAMYSKLVSKIIEVVKATPGNVGLFAASYKVLNGLLNAGIEQKTTKKIFVENGRLSSLENDSLVKKFRAAKHNRGGLLMGVIGGRNSEGTDFGGGDMSSVIVVGVPYAPPSLRTNAKIEYYEQEFSGRGRDYAYHLPALKRASQAAGRAIRSLSDYGVIVLMDYRYSSRYCRSALPKWLSKAITLVDDREGKLFSLVSDFYKDKIHGSSA